MTSGAGASVCMATAASMACCCLGLKGWMLLLLCLLSIQIRSVGARGHDTMRVASGLKDASRRGQGRDTREVQRGGC